MDHSAVSIDYYAGASLDGGLPCQLGSSIQGRRSYTDPGFLLFSNHVDSWIYLERSMLDRILKSTAEMKGLTEQRQASSHIRLPDGPQSPNPLP